MISKSGVANLIAALCWYVEVVVSPFRFPNISYHLPAVGLSSDVFGSKSLVISQSGQRWSWLQPWYKVAASFRAGYFHDEIHGFNLGTTTHKDQQKKGEC